MLICKFKVTKRAPRLPDNPSKPPGFPVLSEELLIGGMLRRRRYGFTLERRKVLVDCGVVEMLGYPVRYQKAAIFIERNQPAVECLVMQCI